MSEPVPKSGEILLYDNGTDKQFVSVVFKGETFWLTQSGLAELFDCSADNISLYLKNIYADGELEQAETTEKISVVCKGAAGTCGAASTTIISMPLSPLATVSTPRKPPDSVHAQRKGVHMKNREQFDEFLRCCRERRVQNIHLAEVCLLVNPAAGDFGSIVIEFERCSFLISSKYLPHEPEDTEIDEFEVKKFEQFDKFKQYDLTERDIYKALPGREHTLKFITELVDGDGYFNGKEWKCNDGYLFFVVSCPAIAVFAAFDEELKYAFYPHQFREGKDFFSSNNRCYELFPNA